MPNLELPEDFVSSVTCHTERFSVFLRLRCHCYNNNHLPLSDSVAVKYTSPGGIRKNIYFKDVTLCVTCDCLATSALKHFHTCKIVVCLGVFFTGGYVFKIVVNDLSCCIETFSHV